MKLYIYGFFTFILSMTVNAQQKIDQLFKDAPLPINEFMQNFPDVKVIDYSDLNNGKYIVGFVNSDDVEMVFKIDSVGNLIQKEQEISIEELPQPLYHKIIEKGKLKYAWQIEKNNGEVLYLVELQKKLKLYDEIYTSTGNLVPTEEYYASLLQ